MTPDQLLTTTRAVRKRLDLGRPVPRELLLECLQIATQAPTGGNRQGWQFVFVSDPAKKKALADLYMQSWIPYSSSRRPTYGEDDVREQRFGKLVDSSQYLADHMHEVPVLMIPCIEGRAREGASTQVWAGLLGSILPATWSFMLAARQRGLGTAWTTLHLKYEREAAEVLGIPYERYTQAAMIPVAYYTGEDFKPAARISLDSIVHFDSW